MNCNADIKSEFCWKTARSSRCSVSRNQMKVYINFPDILVSYTCAYTNTHTKERKKSEKQYLPERLMMASGRAYRAAQKMARWTSLARPNIPESNCQILLVVHFFFFFPRQKTVWIGSCKKYWECYSQRSNANQNAQS